MIGSSCLWLYVKMNEHECFRDRDSLKKEKALKLSLMYRGDVKLRCLNVKFLIFDVEKGSHKLPLKILQNTTQKWRFCFTIIHLLRV